MTGAFWNDILVWAAPKIVLSSALSSTLEELKTRMDGSPLSILGSVFDEGARYTIEMDLDTSDALLGDVDYRMTVQTDGRNHQVFAEGQVTLNRTMLDISVYLNDTFACLSSETLLEDNFYGITYDTFSSDIRSNKILPYLAGEEKLTEWEQSVAGLRDHLAQDRTIDLPEISEKEIQTLILGIIALKADVTADSLVVDGESVKTHKITFSPETAKIHTALNYLVQKGVIEDSSAIARFLDDPDATHSVSFWIFQDSVFKIACEAAGEDADYSLEIILGENAAADTISFKSVSIQDSNTQILSVVSDALNAPDRYTETLKILKTEDDVENNYTIDYDWNKESGDAALTVAENTRSTSLNLNFSEVGEGFRLATEDFASFVELFDGKDREEAEPSSCVMTVYKGASIDKPEYKNLDDWSMEDLLILLDGIGSLFGINM